MNIFEETVINYITHDKDMSYHGTLFVIPQYSVGDESEEACPDFVGISTKFKKIVIVEVSMKSEPIHLVNKLTNQSYDLVKNVRNRLRTSGAITNDNDWDHEIWLFVRQDDVDWLKQRVRDQSAIKIHDLEKTYTMWKWNWNY